MAHPPFSDSYADARRIFLAAAGEAAASVRSRRHPGAPGPDGGPLFLDAARLGPAEAEAVLVVGAGTHGVEGYLGAAVLTDWLRAPAAARLPGGVAVVLHHVHNPWGMAHVSRTTAGNVDLNRNFLDFAQPPPANPGYTALHHLLRPETPDEAAFAAMDAGIEAFRLREGEQACSDALGAGQYDHADGLYYGGRRREWEAEAFLESVREQCGAARRAAFVDLHSGIGGWLDQVFLCFHPPGSPAWSRARDWWGERAVDRSGVTHKAVARYSGLIFDAFAAALPEAETTAICVEFGTLPRERMRRALVADAWRRFGHCDPAGAEAARRTVMDAFAPANPGWRSFVVQRGRAIVDQAVAGLAAG